MYKKTNPQQKLFGVDSQLSPALRNRLKFSWSYFIRNEVLPILLIAGMGSNLDYIM